MPPTTEPAGGLPGVVGTAVAMVACCAAVPAVAASGIAFGAIGLALGSALLLVVGIAAIVWAVRRHTKQRLH